MRNRLRSRLIVALMLLTVVAPGLALAGSRAVFSDGFETGDFSKWSGLIGTPAIQTSLVRSGSFAARITPQGAPEYLSRTLSTMRSELYARLWVRVQAHTTTVSLFRFIRGDGQGLGVDLRADGRIALSNSVAGTDDVSATAIADREWHELQIHARMGSPGSASVWLDGLLLSDVGGEQPLGAKPIAELRLGEDGPGAAADVVVDDVKVARSFIPPSDREPPTAPTGVTAVAPTSARVELAWGASVDDRAVDRYVVYRGPAAIGLTFDLSFTDTAVAPSTTYSYAVQAVDAAGNRSPMSAPVSVRTLDRDVAPPTAPTGLAARASGPRAVELTWIPASDDRGVDGYTVFRDGASIGTTATASFVDATVAPGARYTYAVDAFDAEGNHSAPSDPVEVQVPVDSTAPGIPAGLRATDVALDRVDLAWNESVDDIGVEGYTIYRDGVAIDTSPTTSFSDRSVSPSTTYRYRVDAFDEAGNHSDRSEAIDVSTPRPVDVSPPSVPMNLQPTSISTSRVELDWASSSDDVGVDGYTVYRDGDAIATTSASNFDDTTVIAGATYRYRVDAFDEAGNHSDRSDAAIVDVPAPPGDDPVVMAAGDIACDPADGAFNDGRGTSGSCRQRATSDLLVAGDPDAVLPLGDVQYECGGLQAFLDSFDPSWGRLKAVTRPAIGNHEYDTSGGTDCSTSSNGAGYFQYFGARAGPVGKGWYSFDLGGWHLISLNSECSEVGGCGAGSEQFRWLEADLAAHRATCTLAFWHRPRYGPSSGDDTTSMDDMWDELAAANADIVLAGHVHSYARLKPLNLSGQPDASGIRSFVVGTGGHSLQSAGTSRSIVERAGSDYGVLKLTLHPTGYDWRFLPAAGETFSDQGSGTCH